MSEARTMTKRYWVERVGTTKASIEVVLASDYDASIRQLEEVFKRYGDHDEDCNAANGRAWHPCTCGYSTAITEAWPLNAVPDRGIDHG